MYKIIDAHCHVYPDKIAEKASANTGNFYAFDRTEDGRVSTLLKEGEEAGITHYIIQSVATTPSQVRSINEFIARTVNQSKGKMTGLGTIHPDTEDVETEVGHILDLGLKGIKLHPDIQRFELDCKRSMHIFEVCEGRLPVLLHTGDERYDYSNYNRLIPVLEAFPRLQVIGAHFGGWSMWEESARHLYKYENLVVDCSSSLYAISPDTACELIRLYGAQRVLFGSDYPVFSPKDEVKRFMRLALTDEERQKVLHRNAAELFNITDY